MSTDDKTLGSWRPLAERMRPEKLEDILGQEELCAKGSWLWHSLEKGQLDSLIFWGPPGCGKTTLGRLLAKSSKKHFEFFSASLHGLKDLKQIVQVAQQKRDLENQGTVLFCDEIHRLNKGQQDAFLPHVEMGLITLIGATTENPSFEVNNALLSRCRVVVLKPLETETIRLLLQGALEQDHLLKISGLKPSEQVLDLIAALADGDARQGLNLLESLVPLAGKDLDLAQVVKHFHKAPRFDKGQEAHHNLISALHKSVRASDVQASVYYCVRILESGEDPKYVARRLIRMATEDVGLADPQALVQATAAAQAIDWLGSPEGHLALVQATVYLASAPKSNSAYLAQGAAQRAFKQTGNLAPPMEILNAPTQLMKQLGYGQGYRYDHNWPHHFANNSCLPKTLQGQIFYQPGEFGHEKEIQRRLEWWEKLQRKKSGS